MARKSYLTNIQILRFAAAIMVLLIHLIHETKDQRIPHMQGIQDSNYVAWGAGVDLFFIVSGFIMYYLSSDSFGSLSYAKEFIKRRLVRVAPLYWIFTTLMLIAVWQLSQHVRHSDTPLTTIVASYLFFPVARDHGPVQPVLGLGWTLEYEMFFYVCYTIALCYRRAIGLSILVVGFALFALVGRFIPESFTPLVFWSNPIIIEFLMGIFLAHLYMKNVRMGLVAQIVCIVSGFALMWVMGTYLQSMDRWVWRGVPAFVIAAGMALGPEWKARALTLGGDASYSLYLSHPFTLNILALLWPKIHLPPNAWLYVWLSATVCLVAALGVYWLIEMPVLNFLRRRFEPRRAELSA